MNPLRTETARWGRVHGKVYEPGRDPFKAPFASRVDTRHETRDTRQETRDKRPKKRRLVSRVSCLMSNFPIPAGGRILSASPPEPTVGRPSRPPRWGGT